MIWLACGKVRGSVYVFPFLVPEFFFSVLISHWFMLKSFPLLFLPSLLVPLMIAGSVTWWWIGSGGTLWFCPPALGCED